MRLTRSYASELPRLKDRSKPGAVRIEKSHATSRLEHDAQRQRVYRRLRQASIYHVIRETLEELARDQD
jgi:hypothetical protein